MIRRLLLLLGGGGVSVTEPTPVDTVVRIGRVRDHINIGQAVQ